MSANSGETGESDEMVSGENGWLKIAISRAHAKRCESRCAQRGRQIMAKLFKCQLYEQVRPHTESLKSP